MFVRIFLCAVLKTLTLKKQESSTTTILMNVWADPDTSVYSMSMHHLNNILEFWMHTDSEGEACFGNDN